MCINVYSWIFVCIFFSYICIFTRYVCTVACIFCAKCHISFTVNNLHFFEMNPRNMYRKSDMIFEFSVTKNVFSYCTDISQFSTTNLLHCGNIFIIYIHHQYWKYNHFPDTNIYIYVVILSRQSSHWLAASKSYYFSSFFYYVCFALFWFLVFT